MKRAAIYTDGAARGNPGPAGAGWIICSDEGNVLQEGFRYLGEMTNNQAEYRALLLALGEALRLGVGELKLYADSELMVKQIRGEYKIRNEGLKPLHREVSAVLSKFKGYAIAYLPREKNAHADALANRAIDEKLA